MPQAADDMVQALDPFIAAAYRQRRGVMPEGGRTPGPASHVIENILPHMASKAINTAAIPGNVLREGLPDAGLSEAGAEAAIPKALALSSLGPAASAPRAMMKGGPMDPSTLAALYLQRQNEASPYGFRGAPDNFHAYSIVNDKGKPVGELSGDYLPQHKDFHVGWMGSQKRTPYREGMPESRDQRYFSLGPSDVRSLLMALRGNHPEAKTISGWRVGGARDKADSVDSLTDNFDIGRTTNAQMRIPNFRPEQLDKYWAGAPEGVRRPGPQPLRAGWDQAANEARHSLRHQMYEEVGNIRNASTDSFLNDYIRQRLPPQDRFD